MFFRYNYHKTSEIDSSVFNREVHEDMRDSKHSNDSNETKVRHYKSQFSYAHGSVMCTTVCFHWLISNLLNWSTPMCEDKIMDSIMSWSANIHRLICEREYGHCKMLYQSELIEKLKVPPEISLTEVCGSDICAYLPKIDTDSENMIFLTFDKLPDILKENCGLMITAGAHTVSVLGTKYAFYVFDPASAYVKKIERSEKTELTKLLCHNYDEFDGTLFRVK